MKIDEETTKKFLLKDEKTSNGILLLLFPHLETEESKQRRNYKERQLIDKSTYTVNLF